MNTDDPTLQTMVIDELPEPPTSEPQTSPTEPITPTEPKGDDDVRAAVRELAGIVKQTQEPKKETAPPPTPEEIAEFWAVYDPEGTDKEFFRKFGRFPADTPPEEIQAFKELFGGMQKGLMKQAVTAARNYISVAREEIDKEYGPLREFVEEQKREATRGRFYSEYPTLQEKKFNKIIDATARTLDGKSFASEGEYFKALAEGAAEAIRDILPEFDLGAKPTTKTTPGKTPKLPRTSVGGGGGAGKGAHDDLKPTGSRNDIDSLEDDSE